MRQPRSPPADQITWNSLPVTSACLPSSASCHVIETLGQACGSFNNEAPACGMLRLVSLGALVSLRFRPQEHTQATRSCSPSLCIHSPYTRHCSAALPAHETRQLPPATLYLLSACGPAFGVSGWLQPTLSKSGSPSQRGSSRPSPPTAPVTAPSTVSATTHTRTLLPPHATLPMPTT